MNFAMNEESFLACFFTVGRGFPQNKMGWSVVSVISEKDLKIQTEIILESLQRIHSLMSCSDMSESDVKLCMRCQLGHIDVAVGNIYYRG